SENLLQTLLAKYPNLLAGDQIDSKTPRKWLLITREASLPCEVDGAGRWSVDHLFLDQDGIPTIVEVKRSSDARIRREMVGQMLDYAANAVAYWSISEIRAKYETNCNVDNADPEMMLSDFLDGQFEPDDYWSQVKTNLEAGRIRMLFVADKIPTELQRVIEFLNQQMNPAEVLGIEIKQFANLGIRTLIPRVIGQTASAQDRKSGSPRSSRQWDEESFFAELESRRGSAESTVAKKILDWSVNRGLDIWWGKGKETGSFQPIIVFRDERCETVAVWTYGRVEVQFMHFKKYPPFNDIAMRKELINRLNSVSKVKLTDEAINRRPAFDLSCLVSPEALQSFLDTLEWFVSKVRDADKLSA
ncbi:MAG: hypothetical protein ACYC0V_18170, partial [Armatimonadota bacterium]